MKKKGLCVANDNHEVTSVSLRERVSIAASHFVCICLPLLMKINSFVLFAFLISRGFMA